MITNLHLKFVRAVNIASGRALDDDNCSSSDIGAGQSESEFARMHLVVSWDSRLPWRI